MERVRGRVAALVLAGVALASQASAAPAGDLAVYINMDARAKFTLFTMAGNAILWKSTTAGKIKTAIAVPIVSNGVTITSVCVRLGTGWRVHSADGKTYQVSCFDVDKTALDAGVIGYSMVVERGKPTVSMPDDM